MGDAFATIWRKEGMGGFFKGWAANTLKAGMRRLYYLFTHDATMYATMRPPLTLSLSLSLSSVLGCQPITSDVKKAHKSSAPFAQVKSLTSSEDVHVRE